MDKVQRLVDLFAFDVQHPSGPYRILPVGKFIRNGQEFSVTDDMCAEFVKNFHNHVLDRQVVVNIEHMAEEGAVGWIRSLVHKPGDGLYATIDWTERGLKLLQEQSFRYLSPEVTWRDYEAKDGTRYNHVLAGLALTNYPYFGSQTALFSEWAAQYSEHSGQYLLYMLEEVSHLLRERQREDEPDEEMIKHLEAVREALKVAARYIVDQYRDREGGEHFAVTKREQGVDWTADDFLVVPDKDKPSTWKLRFKEMVNGRKEVTRAQLGRAAAALGPGGFRGQRVQLSAEERATAIRKLLAEYRQLGVKDEEIPKHLFARRTFMSFLRDLWSSEAAGGPQGEEPMGEESKESQEMVTEKDYTEPTPELRRVTEEQFAEMEARFTKALADMRAALEAKTAEVERFRQQYTEEQTARRRQEFVDLAREKFSAIPGVADEIGARLLWLFDADTTPKKDHYTWFTNQLTAMNAVMAEHYREIGYTQPQPAGGGDAFTALLEQKRAALKQANPNLTDAEAYSQALAAAAREDPRGAARWYEKNS